MCIGGPYDHILRALPFLVVAVSIGLLTLGIYIDSKVNRIKSKWLTGYKIALIFITLFFLWASWTQYNLTFKC